MTGNPPSAPDYLTCQHCLRDFAAITVSHLRSQHGYEGDHPIADYKQRFGVPKAACPEVRQKIQRREGTVLGPAGPTLDPWEAAGRASAAPCRGRRLKPALERP